jgi:hypothetical protein
VSVPLLSSQLCRSQEGISCNHTSARMGPDNGPQSDSSCWTSASMMACCHRPKQAGRSGSRRRAGPRRPVWPVRGIDTLVQPVIWLPLRECTDDFLRLDIPGWSGRAEQIMANQFTFHPMAIEDCQNRSHIPWVVHVYPQHGLVVIQLAQLTEARPPSSLVQQRAPSPLPSWLLHLLAGGFAAGETQPCVTCPVRRRRLIGPLAAPASRTHLGGTSRQHCRTGRAGLVIPTRLETVSDEPL